MPMTYESIYDVVVDVVASAAMVEPGQVEADQDFQLDMDLDSLAIFEIVVDLEEAFNLQISDKEIERLHTPGDVAEFIYNLVGKSED